MQLAKVEVIFDLNSITRIQVEKEVEEQLNSLFITYSIGDTFIDNVGREAILAQVGSGVVSFIGLHDGNRYKDPIGVRDVHKITPTELKQLSSISTFKKK